MTATHFRTLHKPLSAVADEIARELAYAKQQGGHQQIVTPLLYPGGGHVVLRLEESPAGYFISDHGAGRREADLMGGGRIFARIAREQAHRHGVNFDSDLIFDIDVPMDAAVAAAVAVANASKASVDMTADALSERKAAEQRMRLWRVLGLAFPDYEVQEDATYTGRSESWQFDAIVMLDKPAIFHTVAPTANSVHAAVSRFLDVRDNGADATIRVSVATALKGTPHISLLARTSQIVSIQDPSSRFASLAEAA